MSTVDTLAIDATYKLNWHGFPLIVLGTVDRQNRFHPLIYACTTNETCDDYVFVFRSTKDGVTKHFPDAKFAPKILIADINRNKKCVLSSI